MAALETTRSGLALTSLLNDVETRLRPETTSSSSPPASPTTRVTRTSVSIVTAGRSTTSITRSPTTSSFSTSTRSPTTSSSSIRPTTTTSSSSIRSTSSSSSTHSSSSSSSALPTSTSTTTVPPSSSSMSTSSSALIPETSSDASKGGEEEGMKLGTGAIAAISVAGALAALALLLVSYRYYKRRQRQNNRMSLSIWAAGDHHRSNSSAGGNTGGWGKRQSEVETNEKDVTPYQIGRDEDEEETYGYGQQRAMGGGSGYSAYPPPQQQLAYSSAPTSGGYVEPRVDAYGRPLSDSQQQAYQQAYPYAHQQQQVSPQPPVIGVIPGTPNTFGSGSQVEAAAAGESALTAAQGRGLIDGSRVVVRQGFVRSLEDELVIAPGDSLFLVQAYDDGWCLCEHSKTRERGVVPLNCLASGSGEGQEVLNVPDGGDGNGMARSPTADSLANSDRSQRRSSLFANAQTAGLYLQQSPTK